MIQTNPLIFVNHARKMTWRICSKSSY